MSNAPASVSDELPVSGKLRETLHRATEAVQDIYGSRLRHLFLFGSHARGEATPESDVDLLVVLEGPIQFYDEAKRTSRVATRAAAYRDTALSFVHMSAEDFADNRKPLVRSVREDGIDLLGLFGEGSSTDRSTAGRSSREAVSRSKGGRQHS